jgi:microcystin-dependent protein
VTTPYLGEIQVFAFDYAPVGWALCNGALLPISQNTALFSLIGTNYGGDGRTNFQLPNFTARAPCSQGTGPGLTPRSIGEPFGDNGVALSTGTMPMHTHALTVFDQPDTTKRSAAPAANYALIPPQNVNPFVPSNPVPNTQFAPNTVGSAGNNLPHENCQPFLAVNFCIALRGAFPSFG